MYKLNTENRTEIILGFLLLFTLLGAAYTVLDMQIFYRFLIGLGFGYALVKASLGFAGSVNKLSRTGSASVAKALMLMFVLTALLSAFLLYNHELDYHIRLNPINMGLFIGGLLFGIGMAFSSCCATGSLTDLAAGFSRAIVTIFFFTMGVFLGFPFQGEASWVKNSWFTSETGAHFKGGVYLPDLFKFDGFNGYLISLLFTALLAYVVIVFAKRYEKRQQEKGLCTVVNTKDEKTAPLTPFERIFLAPWKLSTSITVIALLFTLLLWLSGKGWSATSVFGLWFGKLLMLFGISAETLSEFTTRSVSFFNTPLLENSTSVQNFGIILGAVFALMLAGTFKEKFIAGLKISLSGLMIFATGGFIMGFGTRLSNGCNVGALYTPIAQFSLSGWFYLIVVASGGLIGNWLMKKYRLF